MTATAERQIRAALDARGVPGPPPGPGLWVVQKGDEVNIVETHVEPPAYAEVLNREQRFWVCRAITRHVALFPEVLP